MIYLDNNATTQPSPGVCAAMQRACAELWANPSSVHRAGQAVRREVELARQTLADLIGARAREILLLSGGTESIDLAIRGALDAQPASRALVTTRVEHAAVRDIAVAWEKGGTRPVRWAPLREHGLVDLAVLETLLDGAPGVGLVSIQWANNETGVVQGVGEIAEICRRRGVLFHCDATQWVGKERVPAPVGDLMTFAPHKFHGPKGVGVLWMRPGVALRPRILGAQELGRRGGTENVPGILGAGAAAREALEWLRENAPRARLAALRDEFEHAILAAIPDAAVNARAAPRLWNTTNIAFPRLAAEALLMIMSEQGLCASAGAACSSGSLEPSPVLLAMGIPEPLAHGSIRFSLSRHTTREEIDAAVAIVAGAVARLRGSSSSAL